MRSDREDADIIIRRLGQMNDHAQIERVKAEADRLLGIRPVIQHSAPPPLPRQRQRPDYPAHRGLFQLTIGWYVVPLFGLVWACMACGLAVPRLQGFTQAGPDTQTAMVSSWLVSCGLASVALVLVFVVVLGIAGRFYNKAVDERIEMRSETYRRGFRE